MTRTHGSKELWLTALRADGPAFRAAAATPGALQSDVPTCPEWTVEQLVQHVGAVYEWVRAHVGRGTTSPPESRRDTDLPTGEAALSWWDEQYAALVDLLTSLDPAAPAWNWAPQPKRAEFWHRRMAHETAVHRWDAQVAVGLTAPVDPRLATDGVTEVLDSWLPGGRRRGPTNRSGVAHLMAADVEEEWLVRLRDGGGIALLDTDTLLDLEAPARVHARGSASDLLLALYGRVPFEVVEVSGDASLLESLRTG